MATASARLSEAGRRKRAELCARQRQRGPAPLASFEDISVDRSVDVSIDLEMESIGVDKAPSMEGSNCQKLALPQVSIQVSKASSSASEDSRATTPEADGGFQEDVVELRAATDELGAPHMTARKDSVSSAGSELILPASGRSSRMSSFCSTASGRRSVSPYRTMLETSFCGSRPLAPPLEPDAVPEPRLPALASNGHPSPPSATSPLARHTSPPARHASPPARHTSPPVRRASPPVCHASPPVERRACTLPPHQVPPVGTARKASLSQTRHSREESLSPAMTPDSPLPRRKSSFSRLLSEAKRELRQRSRSRSKSKEREDARGSILSIFKRKASHPRKSESEESPTRSPSLENRLEDEINKVEFKFFDGEPAPANTPATNSVSTAAAAEAGEKEGPDAPVVQGYGNVMRELSSALQQRTSRPSTGAPCTPPALPLKSPSRLRRDFGAASVEHDQPRPAAAELPQTVLPPVGPKPDAKAKRDSEADAAKRDTPPPRESAEPRAGDVPAAAVSRASPRAADEAGVGDANGPDADTRSLRSSGSDKESSAAERSEPTAGPDVEAAQLFQAADSDEDELPYVPTTLPQERPLQQPIVPIELRGSELRLTAGVDRPRSARELTPADLSNYVRDAGHGATPEAPRVRILIPQDSLKLIRTPKRLAMKSWSQFAHEGLQSPRLRRQQRAVTETTVSSDGPRVTVLQNAPSLAEEQTEEAVAGQVVKQTAPSVDDPAETPAGWVRVTDLPEPLRTPRNLSAATSSPARSRSPSSTHAAGDEAVVTTQQGWSASAGAHGGREKTSAARRRSDSVAEGARSPAADCTDCACRLSTTSGSSQELATSGSFSHLPRSPAELREGEQRHDRIQSRLGADCAPVHRQAALLADTLEDATFTYFRAVQENTPARDESGRSTPADVRRRSAAELRKDSYGNALTVERPGSRPRLASTGSVKSRSPSPHKMLIETSFCGRQPVPAPGSFEVDDLVDISHLPSETGSLHTDTDSSGRQSQDGCVCRCHSDAEERDQQRRCELQERLSVGSGSSSSSGPPTCAERPPADAADLSSAGDTDYLLARAPAPFGMDLDVPSNRSSRALSPPPSWPSSPDDVPAAGV